ncbi:SMI1/KNR4 family protein [Pelistega sp. NLN82]|uniref:SMI1/KNR4 family protein n=1 Tax=Pelistega ratti TaxID=2652177 RepID=A0A6L9Y862_9BURK|nr:SMI1/KNR4 family protein [Pelistega ratti]NEN76057.1 SMI1/KNR4 family protein [Pelistega ratti]
MIKFLLEKISRLNDCRVIEAQKVRTTLNLPSDLLEFYHLCNGVELFIHSDYPFKILGIESISSSNKIILDDISINDISRNWFVIAEDYNGDYLSIDLSKNKLGWCYDSFYEIYGLAGNMPIIAKSFTELLINLYNQKGKSLYWYDDNFISYGDAYD